MLKIFKKLFSLLLFFIILINSISINVVKAEKNFSYGDLEYVTFESGKFKSDSRQSNFKNSYIYDSAERSKFKFKFNSSSGIKRVTLQGLNDNKEILNSYNLPLNKENGIATFEGIIKDWSGFKIFAEFSKGANKIQNEEEKVEDLEIKFLSENTVLENNENRFSFITNSDAFDSKYISINKKQISQNLNSLSEEDFKNTVIINTSWGWINILNTENLDKFLKKEISNLKGIFKKYNNYLVFVEQNTENGNESIIGNSEFLNEEKIQIQLKKSFKFNEESTKKITEFLYKEAINYNLDKILLIDQFEKNENLKSLVQKAKNANGYELDSLLKKITVEIGYNEEKDKKETEKVKQKIRNNILNSLGIDILEDDEYKKIDNLYDLENKINKDYSKKITEDSSKRIENLFKLCFEKGTNSKDLSSKLKNFLEKTTKSGIDHTRDEISKKLFVRNNIGENIANSFKYAGYANDLISLINTFNNFHKVSYEDSIEMSKKLTENVIDLAYDIIDFKDTLHPTNTNFIEGLGDAIIREAGKQATKEITEAIIELTSRIIKNLYCSDLLENKFKYDFDNKSDFYKDYFSYEFTNQMIDDIKTNLKKNGNEKFVKSIEKSKKFHDEIINIKRTYKKDDKSYYIKITDVLLNKSLEELPEDFNATFKSDLDSIYGSYRNVNASLSLFKNLGVFSGSYESEYITNTVNYNFFGSMIKANRYLLSNDVTKIGNPVANKENSIEKIYKQISKLPTFEIPKTDFEKNSKIFKYINSTENYFIGETNNYMNLYPMENSENYQVDYDQAKISNEVYKYKEGVFDIKTKIQGKSVELEDTNSTQLTDIIILLDNSKSMDRKLSGTDKNRKDASNEAITNFVNSIVKDNKNIRVGLITYSYNTNIYEFSSVKEDILKNLPKITNYYTFTQRGLLEAEKMFNRSKSKNKILVHLTDGAPTDRYKELNDENNNFIGYNYSSTSVNSTFEKCLKAVEWEQDKLLNSGVKIYNIGMNLLDSDKNADLIKETFTYRGIEYFDVVNVEKLQDSFKDLQQRIYNKIDNGKLEISFADEFELVPFQDGELYKSKTNKSEKLNTENNFRSISVNDGEYSTKVQDGKLILNGLKLGQNDSLDLYYRIRFKTKDLQPYKFYEICPNANLITRDDSNKENLLLPRTFARLSTEIPSFNEFTHKTTIVRNDLEKYRKEEQLEKEKLKKSIEEFFKKNNNLNCKDGLCSADEEVNKDEKDNNTIIGNVVDNNNGNSGNIDNNTDVTNDSGVNKDTTVEKQKNTINNNVLENTEKDRDSNFKFVDKKKNKFKIIPKTALSNNISIYQILISLIVLTFITRLKFNKK